MKKYLLSLLLVTSCFTPLLASKTDDFSDEMAKKNPLKRTISQTEGNIEDKNAPHKVIKTDDNKPPQEENKESKQLLVFLDEEKNKEANTSIISLDKVETKEESSIFFQSSVKKSTAKGWKLKGSFLFPGDLLQNIASFLTSQDILPIALTSREALSAMATPLVDDQILESPMGYQWIISRAYQDYIHDKENISKEDVLYNFPPIRLQEHGNLKNAYYKLSKQFDCFDENFIHAKKYLQSLDNEVTAILLGSNNLKAVPSLDRFLDLMNLQLSGNTLSFFNMPENSKLMILALDDNHLSFVNMQDNLTLMDLSDFDLRGNNLSLEEKKKITAKYPLIAYFK
jgi:hypothetical protein